MEAAVLAERLARLGTRVDAAALEHQPDPRPKRSAVPATDRRIDAEDPRRAPIRAPVALDDLDRGRLARPVRSEQRDELPAADRQRDAVEDGPRPVALDQPVNDDHRVAGRHCAIRAYWRSKSASVSSPIWIERTTPVRSTK